MISSKNQLFDKVLMSNFFKTWFSSIKKYINSCFLIHQLFINYSSIIQQLFIKYPTIRKWQNFDFGPNHIFQLAIQFKSWESLFFMQFKNITQWWCYLFLLNCLSLISFRACSSDCIFLFIKVLNILIRSYFSRL
jgi:hypothetical protein